MTIVPAPDAPVRQRREIQRPNEVGITTTRADGVPKVKGEFEYASDMRMDGMLHGATLRSLGARFVAGGGSDGRDAADRGTAANGTDAATHVGGVSTCGVGGGQGGVDATASTRGQQEGAAAPAFGERGCGFRPQADAPAACNQGAAYDATYLACGDGSDGAAGVGGLPPDPTPLVAGILGDVGWLPSTGRAGRLCRCAPSSYVSSGTAYKPCCSAVWRAASSGGQPLASSQVSVPAWPR